MIKKRKRLYMFRNLFTNDAGLIRAYSAEEACDIVVQHYGRTVELKPVPRNFIFFMPRF